METDVLIIGGGVVGTAIARELSRFNIKTVLTEKEDDVAMGSSKANSGIIHAGYDAAELCRGQLNIEANPVFDRLCLDLKVPFKRIGSLVVGFESYEHEKMIKQKEIGTKHGVTGLEVVTGERLFKMEPELNPKATCALYAPTAGIISPYELVIGLADNAVINGAKVMLNNPVTGFIMNDGKIEAVTTRKETIKAKIVINAAGLYSDKIASLARGKEIFEIQPNRGEYLLLDKKWGGFVNHVLFPMPTPESKGILITPTVHGNLMLGPNSEGLDSKKALSTSESGLNEVSSGAKRLVPGVPTRDIVTTFSGLRAKMAGEDDFIIAPDTEIRGLIHAAGIQSPGLSAAPAIAKKVIEIIGEVGTDLSPELELQLKDDFTETLPEKPRLSDALQTGLDWGEVFKKNSDYGEAVCRCEQVSKGEVIAAINSQVPALTLDAIKRRTRAGMGRCQGGFCSHRIVQILSSELGISPLKITKKGKGSEILVCRVKELLDRGERR